MRVLIAPECFEDLLSAGAVAEAIAVGWARRAPRDALDLAPLAGGGAGFVAALHRALGGQRHEITVLGERGESRSATVLLAGDTAFLSADDLIDQSAADPGTASSHGVGVLVRHALDTGAARLVVGVGPGGVLDGGAGLLAALGATADIRLDSGWAGLAGIGEVRLDGLDPRLGEVELILASDDAPVLTGMFGAGRALGAGFGLGPGEILAADQQLGAFAALAGRRVALVPGAGAGGGIGFGLLLAGARRVPAVDVVVEALGLPARAAAADLVLTAGRRLTPQTRAGTVLYAVAALAAEALRPCVALAGELGLGARELRALGFESAYAVEDGELLRAHPEGALGALAERVARTWSR